MPHKPTDPTSKFDPYDLSAIADVRNRHKEAKFRRTASNMSHESKQPFSAYDLSQRPDDK